jgi:adenosylhomocysteine nucleosidase
MGPANARRAADTLIKEIQPDIIISIGFCGALTPGLAVGDLVVADQLYLLTEAGLTREEFPKANYPDLSTPPPTGGCFHGSFITTETAVAKESLRPLLPGKPDWPVLEMETAFIARACRDAGIRFAALRSVSDSADEEPYHLFRAITVNQFDITAKSIITALMRQPGLILQLFRLGRNAARAGKTLALQVQRILEQLS